MTFININKHVFNNKQRKKEGRKERKKERKKEGKKHYYLFYVDISVLLHILFRGVLRKVVYSTCYQSFLQYTCTCCYDNLDHVDTGSVTYTHLRLSSLNQERIINI